MRCNEVVRSIGTCLRSPASKRKSCMPRTDELQLVGQDVPQCHKTFHKAFAQIVFAVTKRNQPARVFYEASAEASSFPKDVLESTRHAVRHLEVHLGTVDNENQGMPG